MKLSDKKLNFVIDYALCYLHAAWCQHENTFIQEDLNMEYKDFIKIINKFQGNKIKVKQYPTE